MNTQNIAIIGGGIAGLASAIFFAREGCDVTIYEQAKEPGPVGAGFLLQPPGQQVLAQLGVLNDVLEHAAPIHGLQSQTIGGYSILDLDYRDLPGAPRHGLGVQRSTIYNALYRKAQSSSGITFRWGHTVEHVAGDNATVQANGQSNTYDLCVLASGANSDLAAEFFPRRVRSQYTWGCIWTTIDLPAGFSPELLHQRCHRADHMMGILPVLKTDNAHKAALYWSIKVDDAQGSDDRQNAAIKQQIMDFWPDAAASIEPLELPDFICATYRDVWTPNPVNGRAVAIGDVCHATSPQLGQGCTMALLDAAWLVRCVAEHDSLEAALQRWWKIRKRQLVYVRQLSRFLTPLYQSDNRLYGVFRNALVAPTGRLPGFYRLQLKTLASEVFLEQPGEHEID